MSAANFHAEDLQALVVTQLTTDDIRRSKCFVRLRAADNGLFGPIAILIVLVCVLLSSIRKDTAPTNWEKYGDRRVQFTGRLPVFSGGWPSL
jgi:hypothetical protein